MLAFNCKDDDRSVLQRKVWELTPWMIDVFTGEYRRHEKIRRWCYDTFGMMSSPIHEIAGTWREGGATVHGHTWYGFASEEQMQEFIAEWGGSEEVGGADEIAA